MTLKTAIFSSACFAIAAFLYAIPAKATEKQPNLQLKATASAFAPSVGTNNDCLIATPASKAFSVLLFSASGTTGQHYSGLCLAYKMGDLELAQKLMCLEDSNYKKLNPKCK